MRGAKRRFVVRDLGAPLARTLPAPSEVVSIERILAGHVYDFAGVQAQGFIRSIDERPRITLTTGDLPRRPSEHVNPGDVRRPAS